MKTAFITGIAGQDGSYLSEHLLSLGYRVTGIVRRNSTVEHQRNRLFHMPSLELEYGDLTDQSSLERALRLFKPDEIYNLGAQSHVRISTDIPQFTAQVNALGVLNLLESYRHICPDAKFYQASSSEMFGSAIDSDGFQRETSKMTPVSPYGCSKVFAYNVVHNYRIGHKLFASNGILFNHESPRRGSNFVTNKVVKGAVEIKLGLATTLEMGNMDSFRDWGHSKDYVKAMHLILQHDKADDFVVATGETRSVRDMCNYVFSRLGLNYADHVVQNPKYLRPEELKYLRGDSTKIRTTLDWKPEYTFNMLMDEMIEFWMKIYQDQQHTV
jgi:GDPmannose 4,6-dehydratase